jgi:hypothetical protein
VRVCYSSAGRSVAGSSAVSWAVGFGFKECVHDVQAVRKVDVQEALALFVAFLEAVGAKRRAELLSEGVATQNWVSRRRLF